jgi:peptidoglycan/xylan/chitin deacetylase (PgdA/CDA1 family)
MYKRILPIKCAVPIISFSFDDAPRTAFKFGSKILGKYKYRGTYFVALGLLGLRTEVGEIGLAEDLIEAFSNGHEIGCHTFYHMNSWMTQNDKYIESVVKNRLELERIIVGAKFKTFAYPISLPKPQIKFLLQKYFICCRGGGQTINYGITDLNLLKAYFIDKRNNHDLSVIKRIIDYNSSKKGWLIFATHDVANNPSPFGCTPEFFEKVVDYAASSGSLLLTVQEACEKLIRLNAGENLTVS